MCRPAPRTAPDTRFQPLLGDTAAAANGGAVETVVLCSGKVYYDLVKQRYGIF